MAWLCPPVSMRVLSTDQAILADISIDRDSFDTAAASLPQCLPPFLFSSFLSRPYLPLITSCQNGRRLPDPTDHLLL